MKVLRVIELQMIADKNKSMFEINRLLTQPDPEQDVMEKLVDAVEKYSSASLSLEVVQKLIDSAASQENAQTPPEESSNEN
jgi:hypothetical protein